MAKIEGIRIKNWGVLRDITIGKPHYGHRSQPLTPMTVVIGRNGVGKSSLFDAFGFLADCLKLGVEEACDAKGRGGFSRICSKGRGQDPLEFQIYYRESPGARPIGYMLKISADREGRPYVSSEQLQQGLQGRGPGRPFTFLYLQNGEGLAWKGTEAGERIDAADPQSLTKLIQEGRAMGADPQKSTDREFIELEERRRLGIATLGALKQRPRISAFRKFIEGWYLSYFTPDAARSLPSTGPQRHLSIHGDNLGNVAQFMQREHKRGQMAFLRSAGQAPTPGSVIWSKRSCRWAACGTVTI